MRLWIDVREACRLRKTGKGQWTLRCVAALLQRTDCTITLLTDASLPPAWESVRHHMLHAKGFWWHVRAWRLLVREKNTIDAYLSPTSFIVPFLAGKTLPVLPVVHDLIAFRNEPHDRKARLIERLTLPRTLLTAANLCTTSSANNAALRAVFPHAPIAIVVGAGPTVEEERTWTGGGEHVLAIGTLCPRKNQLRLIDAFASLSPEARAGATLILIGGRGWNDDDIVERAAATPGVTWMGFQDDATCRELLRTCRAFAFVSEEEGFGLPVLDALRVGAPVLASDIPTNREIAEDCAAYCDPLSVASIADGLRAVLTGDARERQARGIARASAFSWQGTAEATLNACRSAVDKLC